MTLAAQKTSLNSTISENATGKCANFIVKFTGRGSSGVEDIAVTTTIRELVDWMDISQKQENISNYHTFLEINQPRVNFNTFSNFRIGIDDMDIAVYRDRFINLSKEKKDLEAAIREKSENTAIGMKKDLLEKSLLRKTT